MRFLLRLLALLLLLASLPLAVGFSQAPYAGLAARVAQPNFGLYGGVVALPLTPSRYLVLRVGLGAVALLAGAGWLLLRRPAKSRRANWGLGAGADRLWARCWQPVRWLTPAQRGLAAGLGLAVVAARLYYAGWYPLSLDEIASYDYSVLPGPAVTASYYPFPNNHVLPNLLVGVVHRLLPLASPTLALRLVPTLLGLLALPLTYALLLRYLPFGVATLALGWFNLSPLAVYYAVAGRGYAAALLAALAGLLATLELLRPGGGPPARRRLVWVVFATSGVVGLYAVPSHLYALLGLGLGLLVGFGWQPRRLRYLNLGYLVVVSVGMGLVAAVLYAPVGAVSGWPALLANRYVARHEWAEFRPGFGPFLVITAAELLGQQGLSAAAYVLLLALAPLALSVGCLPASTRRLGWLAYAQLGVWLPVAALQGVYPPARTLLLVLLAFFLLLLLSGQALLARWQPALASTYARSAAWRPLLGIGLLLAAYGCYRLAREQIVIQLRVTEQTGLRRDYAWLRAQPLRRVWVEPRAYAIFWQHYALSAGQSPLPLVVVDDVPSLKPTTHAEVEVLKVAPAPPRPAQPVRYRSAQLVVIPVSPTQPLVRLP
jgi:hypothetical protein